MSTDAVNTVNTVNTENPENPENAENPEKTAKARGAAAPVRGLPLLNEAARRRMAALGRAELTLLVRNKSALFIALALPLFLTFSIRQGLQNVDLSSTGLSMATVLLPGSVGMVLIFAVHSNLVGVYVARREELVLKRLRTGQASDPEILTAASLPAVTVGAVQALVLMVGGALVLDVAAPARPDLLVAGFVLGTAMMVALAAATAGVTRTAEMAQLTGMPLMLISFFGSGMFIPLEVLPDRMADVCQWLPMSPVIELLRGGWTGELGTGGTLRALGAAVVWTVLGIVAVRRWFRWEPRR